MEVLQFEQLRNAADASTLLAAAQVALKQHNFIVADALLHMAEELEPNRLDVALGKALSSQHCGNLDELMIKGRRSIARDPELYEALEYWLRYKKIGQISTLCADVLRQ